MRDNRSSSGRRPAPEQPATTQGRRDARAGQSARRPPVSLRDQATNRLPELPPPEQPDADSSRQAEQRRPSPRGGWFGRLAENYRDHGSRELATALAFNALTALVPLAMLVFLAVSLLAQFDSVRDMVDDVLSALLSTPDADATLDFIRAGRRSAGGISLVAIVGLAYGGHRLFNGLNQALSAIYGAPGRVSAKQKVAGMIMAPAVALLLLLSTVAACLTTMAFIAPSYVGIDTEPSWPAAVVGYLIAVIVAMMVGSVVYSVFPRDEPAETIGPGAFFFALAFSLLSQVFPLYAWLVQGVDQLTGIFALVLLCLIWLYVTGQIIVVGAEINALITGRRASS